MANNSPQARQAVQFAAMADSYTAQQQQSIHKKENKTGLPDNLKSGMENLLGYSMDDVTVHYNSDKPAQLQAYAYAQGTDIHLASGQEKHLPHELGHVVQQKEGRVNPTTSVCGMSVNDDVSLDDDATIMGNKALQRAAKGNIENVGVENQNVTLRLNSIIQRVDDPVEKTVLKEDEQEGVKADVVIAMKKIKAAIEKWATA